MGNINNEIKQEILEKIKSGKTVKEVAEQYGVSGRTIYVWLKKGVISNVSTLEFGRLKKENRILKEIVGGLTIELEKIKKKTR
jgi:excisionase family DNA binding protein